MSALVELQTYLIFGTYNIHTLALFFISFFDIFSKKKCSTFSLSQ